MTISVGKTPEEMDYLWGLLSRTHMERVVVQVMDLRENVLMSATEMFQTGQVNISANNDITRTSTLQFLDPGNEIPITDRDRVFGANYYNKIIAVYVCVWEFGSTRSYDIPVFRGPVTAYKRTGVFLELGCSGKEILARNAFWKAKKFKKGQTKSSVIQSIFTEYIGEPKTNIPASAAKLGEDHTYTRTQVCWAEAVILASSYDRFLMYDGRGVAHLREYPAAVAKVLHTGTDGSIVEEPSMSSTTSDIVNCVIFKGHKFEVIAYAPADHPVNHNNMKRLVPVYYPALVEDSKEKSKSKGATRAKKSMAAYLEQETAIDMTITPPYLLEENDMVAIKVRDEYYMETRVRDLSYTLGDTKASFGSTKNLLLETVK